MNFLCFVDRASVYSPVTKPTCRTFFYHSVHVSGCFGRSTGEITVFMGTWYLFFCVDVCLVCTRQSSTQKITVVFPDNGRITAGNM